MNDTPETPDPADDDSLLVEAGARLRERVGPIPMSGIERAAQRRRLRRLGGVAAAAVLVALLGGVLIGAQAATNDGDGRPGAPTDPNSDEVDELVASLGDEPIDPTDVRLVSSVSTFADCDALVTDLRHVAAEHVGSRGFGGFGYGGFESWSGDATSRLAGAEMGFSAQENAVVADQGGGGGRETIGTNVQVEGVDELDHVKAAGDLVYDLDGKGNLRITDAGDLAVLSTLDVTPGRPPGEEGSSSDVSDLLVADGTVAVFGSETEVSPPVEGDPSATQAAVSYMTVTFVDADDPADPMISDRVRIEGSLVAARLVGGEIRLVTTSNMADLGFVMPTTPASVATALDQNRRVAASSSAGDWIPDWEREGEDAQPLVPCTRVHVPDTFSGVAMTSMVTFPIGTGRFAPQGTSMLAPGATLYAGLDRVAISSEVWVDPIDRDRLEFDDWQTAIHEFSFGDDEEAPSYDGSGIVDGSTVGQFAFGEIGDSLAVVTTEGTPWQQSPDAVVDLTVLSPDGDGALTVASQVEDLADGSGAVTAVRFVEGRVLVSAGFFGRVVSVIDVTDPAAPRRAGSVTVPGDVGYFHPLPDGKALIVGSRTDEVGSGNQRRTRSWVVAQLLDVGDADAPAITSTWERPWSADQVGYDHHAFTYWPERNLAMWGIQDTQGGGSNPPPNHALVLGVDGAVTEVAVPEASKPDEVPPPCPAVELSDQVARDMLGPDGIALRCDDPDRRSVDWPRYQCYGVDDETIARFAPGEEDVASFFACSPAPPPTVGRVLVVSGQPMLLTDQTLERLDPTTFASAGILYHPTAWVGGI